MRISRKKRPDKPLIPHYQLNDRIRVPEVRVIGDNNENLGVMTLEQALHLAEEKEMDLVEINPTVTPPVCKIVDFSHFKYQKEKEARKQKVQTHETETKGVRLSVRIGEHDLEIRVEQSEKFLDRGDKVKVEIILKGRENTKPQLAFEVLKKYLALIKEKMEIRTEQEPTKQGNKVTAIIAKK
ncbi:MAG TPA: translation initiation factor IF-3 [Candidatus Magasanikbacteria bacterium]|nr:translation initiation factor IF-3 [Candidatus Magasanikbacteria bacterium]